MKELNMTTPGVNTTALELGKELRFIKAWCNTNRQRQVEMVCRLADQVIELTKLLDTEVTGSTNLAREVLRLAERVTLLEEKS